MGQQPQVFLPSMVNFKENKKASYIDPQILAQIRCKGGLNIAKVPIIYYPLQKTVEPKAKAATTPNKNCVIESKIASKLPPFKKQRLEQPLKQCKKAKIRVSSN